MKRYINNINNNKQNKDSKLTSNIIISWKELVQREMRGKSLKEEKQQDVKQFWIVVRSKTIDCSKTEQVQWFEIIPLKQNLNPSLLFVPMIGKKLFENGEFTEC